VIEGNNMSSNDFHVRNEILHGFLDRARRSAAPAPDLTGPHDDERVFGPGRFNT